MPNSAVTCGRCGDTLLDWEAKALVEQPDSVPRTDNGEPMCWGCVEDCSIEQGDLEEG